MPPIIVAIVLAVTGHVAPVTCTPHALGGFGAAPIVDGQATIVLRNDACRGLRALVRDPAGAKLVAQPLLRDFNETSALLAVIHEAEHVRQFDQDAPPDERDAQCVAMREIRHWLRVIGVPTERRAALWRDAVAFTKLLPRTYQGGTC